VSPEPYRDPKPLDAGGWDFRDQAIERVLKDTAALGAIPPDGIPGESVAPRLLEWNAAALVNSWANFASTSMPAGYLRDSDGFVHLRGELNGGASDSDAFVLPVGFRPAYFTHQIVSAYDNAASPFNQTGLVRVASTGGVHIWYAAGADSVNITGVYFDTRP
jgi:hypothetical protein